MKKHENFTSGVEVPKNELLSRQYLQELGRVESGTEGYYMFRICRRGPSILPQQFAKDPFSSEQ